MCVYGRCKWQQETTNNCASATYKLCVSNTITVFCCKGRFEPQTKATYKNRCPEQNVISCHVISCDWLKIGLLIGALVYILPPQSTPCNFAVFCCPGPWN